MSDHQNLPDGGNKEQEDGNDRYSEHNSVQSASKVQVREICRVLVAAETEAISTVTGSIRVGLARAKRCLNNACTAVRAMAGKPCNSNEPADEAEIEENCQEAEEGVATKTQSENDSENRVESCGASDTFNSLPSAGDAQVVVGQNGQEVGENSKSDA